MDITLYLCIPLGGFKCMKPVAKFSQIVTT